MLIATPEHWHAQMVLDALAAGKDVYVEKPLCQTPEQGIEADGSGEEVEEHHPVRHAAAQLSICTWKARKIVAAGTLGKVRMVRSWWLNNYLGAVPTIKLDGPLDWEQWQGPAPRRPLDPDRFRNWRYYSDYAGGIVADQGAHVFDGIHC